MLVIVRFHIVQNLLACRQFTCQDEPLFPINMASDNGGIDRELHNWMSSPAFLATLQKRTLHRHLPEKQDADFSASSLGQSTAQQIDCRAELTPHAIGESHTTQTLDSPGNANT